MRSSSRILAALACAALFATGRSLGRDVPDTSEGPLLKPVSREEVYEFARRPTFTRQPGSDGKPIRDRYSISFASRGKCDVAVCIEDGKGRILRHMVYGVLGSNAPGPLQKDSLDQTLTWDGKDDAGKYVRDPQRCVARVSLGLHPTFDKVLDFHPKDSVAGGKIAAIAADHDGVYVLELSCRNQLRMFDHNAEYVRTLYPYRRDKIATKELNIPYRRTENGRTVPKLAGIGGTVPFDRVMDANCMAAAAGKIVLVTGERGTRHLLRFRTDGTTAGESIYGALLHTGFPPDAGQGHLALSPDGKWIYFTGLDPAGRVTGRGRYYWNAVWRVPWERSGGNPVFSLDPHIGEKPFVGTIAGGKVPSIGKDNDQFYAPEGLACDAQGRLYVCDGKNNRLQVFSPEGQHLKTIPAKDPQEIAVHHKTGEIYLLCFGGQRIANGPRQARREAHGQPLTLLKLGPLGHPRTLIEQKIATPQGDWRRVAFTPVFCLDSWASPVRVWLVTGPRRLQVFEEADKSFELFQEFDKEVVKAGLRPHVLGSFRKDMLAVDPVRHHLYYMRNLPLFRCDPEGPGKFVPVEVPGPWQEVEFGLDGLLYLRALRYVARFDPDKFLVAPDGSKVTIPFEAEVPFDYGERQAIRWVNRKWRGVVHIPALPGANSFDTGVGIAPNGDIVAFVKNYHTYENILWGRPKGKWVDAWGPRMRKEMIETGYRPRKFPGRAWNGAELVFRWTARGELVGEDLIPALPFPSCGIATDHSGNLYVGVGANMIVDGKPHAGGALAKFAPTGGRLYGKGDVVKLNELPKRPPEFSAYGWGKLWSRNMYWAYPGYDQMHFLGGGGYPCLCATCRFDTDPYGRSFVPKAYQFCVGVVDTNGNRICEIGRYGNPDSPAMKRGDTDVGLAHCSFLATEPDRWLYLNDDGNSRIIRIKLAYHTEATVPLR